MAKQNINIGTIVNDGAGDSLRDGAIKLNSNFNEIYASLGNGTALQFSIDFTALPAAGQVLQYNSVTGKFVPGNAGAKGDKGDTGSTGPKGDKGDTGDVGPQGIQGIQGEIGPRLSVQGSVSSTLDLPGNNNEVGDILIVAATNDAYVWVQSAFGDSSYEWQNIGPLKGDTGAQGTAGATGATGPQGPTGGQGVAGNDGESFIVTGAVTNEVDLPPSTNAQGDFYVVTSTGDGYIWSPSVLGDSGFEWVNVGPWQGSARGLVWQITASGTSAYVFAGPGIITGITDDPVLYLYRGFTYTFVNNAGGSHPLQIRVSNGGAAYTSGITGSTSGTQIFTVPMNAPSTLYYQCTVHSTMGNVINIV
jgi:hypothetical protein